MMNSPQQETLRAGVIGLGMIGGGVAMSIARHNRPLAVYDIRPDAADKLEGVPPVLESPAAVAKESDVLMIAVLNGKQAKETLLGPNGVLAGAHPGLTIVLLSTITLDELKELQAICEENHIPLLDCGVTAGGLAAQGKLISMIGGGDEAVNRVMPVLREFNAEIHHMGPTGTGMVTKVVRNMIHFTTWRIGFEGGRLAEAAGVDIEKFARLVDEASRQPGASVATWMTPEKLLEGSNHFSSMEELSKGTYIYHEKDLAAAKELADQLGIETPTADTAQKYGKEIYRLDK
jgi:3-hydroxyisobutyrate dehydrogenase-like beta-hydroxyacid dehydrogenase